MAASATILIVDDDPEFRDMLRQLLVKNGYVVVDADCGPAMHGVLRTKPIDLVILDVNLGGENGFDLARELRVEDRVPVVMVTAAGDQFDRIVGLEIGAEDYIVKPFHARELLVRVRNVLRRTRKVASLPRDEAVPFGRCRLDVANRRLLRGEQPVVVSSSDLDMLIAFATSPNRVIRRQALQGFLHRGDAPAADRNVDVRVSRLRRLIEPDPARPSVLRTVRNEGYVFVPNELD